jgi:hypothetical protein
MGRLARQAFPWHNHSKLFFGEERWMAIKKEQIETPTGSLIVDFQEPLQY